MDQNIVVVLIDEELERLQQIRTILASLLPENTALEPPVPTPTDVEEEVEGTQGSQTSPTQMLPPDSSPGETLADAGADVKRAASRRGIRTGPRGPRLRKTDAAPRALDSKVPTAPVVVMPGGGALAVRVAPKPAKSAPVGKLDKLDSLLAAAFATM